MPIRVKIQNKWIQAESATFKETVDGKGKKELFLEALIVPFNKISRNGVKYNEASIRKTYKMIIGKPLMHNHVINGSDVFPRGEWVDSWIAEEGMYGKAKIFQTGKNKDYIEWLENATDPRVSLQVTGDAEQKKDGEDNKYYQEAFIEDWLEASTVNVPGFDIAKGKASFAAAMMEAFGMEEKTKENNTMDNSQDITGTKIATPIVKKDEEDTKEESPNSKKLIRDVSNLIKEGLRSIRSAGAMNIRNSDPKVDKLIKNAISLLDVVTRELERKYKRESSEEGDFFDKLYDTREEHISAR